MGAGPWGMRATVVAFACSLVLVLSAGLPANSSETIPGEPSAERPASCCFHVRLLTDEGVKQLVVLLRLLKEHGDLKMVPVYDSDGTFIQTLWQQRYQGWIIPFATLDPWLCEQNTHICRLAGSKAQWTLRKPPDGTYDSVVGLRCGEQLPSYIVCLPDLRITTYLESLVRQIDRPSESLATLVVTNLRGCKSWDEACQRLVSNLNSTRPQAVDPHTKAYKGEVRLPFGALSVELPFERTQTEGQQVANALSLFDRFNREAGHDDRKGLYAVLTDDRAPGVNGKASPQTLGSLAEGQDLEDQVRKALNYPYTTTIYRAQRDALPTVVIGVWDNFVDDQHCDFKSGGKSVIVFPDIATRDRITASGSYSALRAPPGECASLRTTLKDFVDHGTAVAGVIAAQPLPGWAGGLDPGARVWAANLEDLLSPQGSESEDPVMQFLSKSPLAVINVSEDGGGTNNLSSQFDRILFGVPNSTGAIKERLAHDIVVVVAAGNDGQYFELTTQCTVYPACFGGPRAEGTGFITVTAANLSGDSILRCSDIASLGLPRLPKCDGAPVDTAVVNYGSHFDVAAPGVAFTPVYGDFFSVQAGTSLAAPRVAALASLLIADASSPGGIGHPPAAADVRARILGTADDFTSPDGKIAYARFGIVNFARALAFRTNVIEYRDPDAQCEPCREPDFSPSANMLDFTYGTDPATPGRGDRISWKNIIRLHRLQPDDPTNGAFEVRWIEVPPGAPPTVRKELIMVGDKEFETFLSPKKGRWHVRILDLKEFTSCAFAPGCPSAAPPS